MDGSAELRADDQRRIPPYIPFQTFKTLIQDLKEHGIPARIDRSVLTRFSGQTGTQLMTALRFLHLIDKDGRPTEALPAIVTAYDTPQWTETLRLVIAVPYGPALNGIDLGTATSAQFTEAFRKAFPAQDSVLQKCIAFFLPAAKDAGVIIGPRILAGKKPRGPIMVRRLRKPLPILKKPQPTSMAPPSETQMTATTEMKPPSSYQLVAMLDPSNMTPEEQAAVWLLIQYAKKKEAQPKD